MKAKSILQISILLNSGLIVLWLWFHNTDLPPINEPAVLSSGFMEAARPQIRKATQELPLTIEAEINPLVSPGALMTDTWSLAKQNTPNRSRNTEPQRIQQANIRSNPVRRRQFTSQARNTGNFPNALSGTDIQPPISESYFPNKTIPVSSLVRMPVVTTDPVPEKLPPHSLTSTAATDSKVKSNNSSSDSPARRLVKEEAGNTKFTPATEPSPPPRERNQEDSRTMLFTVEQQQQRAMIGWQAFYYEPDPGQ